MATETFDSSTTWTCPADVTSVDVACIGSGSGAQSTGSYYQGERGGGGGAYSYKAGIAVTPSSNYTVTAPAGGALGATGGDAWFSSTVTVLAKGGNSFFGGASGSGVGDTKYSGGIADTSSSGNGGGGGSSGGSGGNGVNSSGFIGGTAPTGGGNGGNGAQLVGLVASTAGSGPGGGGGGGLGAYYGSVLGSAGAAGRVVLTYTAGGGGGGSGAASLLLLGVG